MYHKVKGNEFKDYALKHAGLSSMKLDRYEKTTIENIAPYVIEEREMRVTQIDIFSRLMKDRIMWINSGINSDMASIVQAQLMFLDDVSNADITLHISSGGGGVSAGLSIIDVMDYIKSDVVTVNTETCASMGAVLLAAGTKGKRSSLRFSRTMIHQSSGGTQGTFTDAEIQRGEWVKINEILYSLLAKYTGKKIPQIIKDANRDLWLSAEEAKKYGLIDNVIVSKK